VKSPGEIVPPRMPFASMSSRAPFLAVPFVLAVGLASLAACSSGSVESVVTSPSTSGGGSPGLPAEAGIIDAADAADESMAAVVVYQGSPLCNASPATSCCYPDALTLCEPMACESLADAGPNEGAGGYVSQVAYGCHLTPAPPTPPASATSPAADDATSAAAAQPVTPACTPAGLGLDGASCKQPNDCAPGYECVGDGGTCRHYCCAGNSACLLDQFCDIQQTTGGTAMSVPVCMPVRQCDLLAPEASACPSGQTCAVVREDGSESCLALGSATVGQSCETDHCADGLVCLGATVRTCYTLCHMGLAGQCPATQSCKGGPPLFIDPGVGVCQ
jgi:hypothetical protein